MNSDPCIELQEGDCFTTPPEPTPSAPLLSCIEASFTTLPVEIIYQIFSYVDTLFLHRVVSRTCKNFNRLLNDELMWKKICYGQNNLKNAATYPYIDHLGLYSQRWRSANDTSWRDLCVSLERAKLAWDSSNISNTSFPVYESHLDCVHVIGGQQGRRCLTGSRERTIRLWDVHNRKEAYTVPLAHNGWITAFTSMKDNKVVSSGWDYQVKLWSMTSSELRELNLFKLDLGVMDVTSKDSTIAACTFPQLVLIDPRIGRSDGLHKCTIGSSLNHLAYWKDHSIILTSRPKKLIHFDLRAMKSVSSVEVPLECSLRTMALKDNVAFVGDNGGKVYMFDLERNFSLIDEFDVCQKKTQMRVVIPRKGHMIVGSGEGALNVVQCMKEANQVKVIAKQTFGGEITAGHYADNAVAIVCQVNGTVQVHCYELYMDPTTIEQVTQ